MRPAAPHPETGAAAERSAGEKSSLRRSADFRGFIFGLSSVLGGAVRRGHRVPPEPLPLPGTDRRPRPGQPRPAGAEGRGRSEKVAGRLTAGGKPEPSGKDGIRWCGGPEGRPILGAVSVTAPENENTRLRYRVVFVAQEKLRSGASFLCIFFIIAFGGSVSKGVCRNAANICNRN